MAMPMANIESRDAQTAPRCLALLGISEQGGRDETPEVEGRIPRELKGSLYRNGPGLFERGSLRKPHLLDGDGLVQRLSFANGIVHYQNAFVRTPKFIAEEEADTFRFATWSMQRPGGSARQSRRWFGPLPGRRDGLSLQGHPLRLRRDQPGLRP